MKAKSQRRRGRQAVFLFREDNGHETSLSPQVRGGKGAGLAQMARLGVPVPPGFTVTTTVARAFSENGVIPRRLAWQIERGIKALERETGKGLSNPDSPLLLSVRSGAAVSMPGMMDTVLNLGLNPATVKGLAREAGERFAYDCYRRFLAMFGEVVLGIPRQAFEQVLATARVRQGVETDQQLEAEALADVCDTFRDIITGVIAEIILDDPRQQLHLTFMAVLKSWNNERARVYREAHGIPEWWGTAVNVQAMVFGNRGDDSGTGVVFSRNVKTGEPGLYGEFLVNAQGEDVVAGIRTPQPIGKLAAWSPSLYAELDQLVRKLEDHYGDVVDVEFTIESGRLYILQSRVAKRTPEAAATIAVHYVWDQRLSRQEALERVNPEQVEFLRSPQFVQADLDEAIETSLLVRGLAASPGAAVGMAVFSSEDACRHAAQGRPIILIRPDTSPEDLGGMMAAEAVVTATGGETSHAAVVARGMGKPAVVGASDLRFEEGRARVGNTVINPGVTISVDGRHGVVVLGGVERADANRRKEVNIFLRWLERFGPPPMPHPRMGFEWVGNRTSLHRLLNDFYLSDAMARQSAGTALESEAVKLRNRIHAETAECLAAYLGVAVASELRHTDAFSLQSSTVESWRRLEAYYELSSRDKYTVLDRLSQLTLAEQQEFFRLAEEIFAKGSWASAYGGQAWAQIARAPLKFLSSELSHSVFADHVFDLQHNTGHVFDKSTRVIEVQCATALQRQLDVKKRVSGVLALYAEIRKIDCCYSHREAAQTFSPEVIALLERGEKLGIWAAAGKAAA